MAPSFIDRLRARGLPLEPPKENPMQDALEKWSELRAYSQMILEMAHETNDANRTLGVELDALRRDNERLHALNVELSRENRVIRSYAESLRTRLATIREQMEVAERESLEYANREVRVHQELTEHEEQELGEVASNITRINPESSDDGSLERHINALVATSR